EAQHLTDELERLQMILGGIKDMRRLPGAIFVIDTKKEHTAVLEARRLEIPVIALADTNTDPDEMDYPIPANDDAIRAVKLLATKIADAALSGRRQYESARERDEGGATGGRRGAAVVRLEEFGAEPDAPAAATPGAGELPPLPTGRDEPSGAEQTLATPGEATVGLAETPANLPPTVAEESVAE
ncbi:MAG TPA: 30S ribosomal protein S2, partial [Ktedonobacterales bacterium]|nr:30S ribosomal protein S2 [Ktedonobacterales bacterium]